MIKYILDTDTLSFWQAGLPLVKRRIESHQRQGIAISIVTVEEQFQGWKSRLDRARRTELERISNLSSAI